MSNIRREFRSQLTRGAWVYAVVESTAMGKATVRLATNGARLTNCPILGASVAPGEKVVVDYSAEGTPIVRPYTIRGEELPKEPEEPGEPEKDNTTWCYAKYTVSDQTIADGGGMRVYIQDNYVPVEERYSKEAGFAYGAYAGQYAYQDNFTNTIPFNEAITDNIGILSKPGVHNELANPNDYGYFAPPRGAYIITLCVALDITTNDLGWMGLFACFDCTLNGNAFPHTSSGNQSIPVHKREHHAVWRMTWYVKFDGIYWWSSQGYATGQLHFGGILDDAGNNIYDYTNPPYHDPSKMTYLKYAKRDGVYPIIEFYKVADIGTYKTAVPYWNWENYDYPDG